MRIITDGPGDLKHTEIGDMMVLDKQVIQHRSGKIFVRYLLQNLIQTMTADMHRNIRRDFDNVVVVQGAEGSGKSNLAWQICHAFDPAFSVSEQYVYDYQDFLDKIQGHEDHPIWWMDEGSNLANNRDWNTEGNKTIVSMLEMMRSRGWTLVMCIPHVERLDKYIRENRIRYLMRCEPMDFEVCGQRDRGYCELRKCNAYGSMSLIGYGEYDQMPEDVRAEYGRIKLEAQEAKIRQVVDKATGESGGTWKKRYEDETKRRRQIMLALRDHGMTKTEIMRICGVEKVNTYDSEMYRAKKEREADGN